MKKVIALILTVLLTTGPVAPVLAEDAPTPPTAPTAPTAPEAPSTSNEAQQENEEEPNESDWDEDESPQNSEQPQTTEASSLPSGQQTGSQTQDGQVGDTSIDTGDATNTAGINSAANSNLNLAASPLLGQSSGPSVGVVNSGNGTDSTSNGSALVSDNNQTLQNNSAGLSNSLNQTSVSGQNSASGNVGGTTSIDSGNANTSGTIITAVNTNVDGVAVAEFTVADDYIGDIVLDFGPSCLVGCGDGPLLVKNTDNGSSSTNTGSIDQIVNDLTFQTNEASVENSMTLASDSGNNVADANTGGDSSIDSGDANVSANVLTFANNNLSGNVYYGVVNIYGDLVGDIIFPEELLNGCCVGSSYAANIANGTDSTNTANIAQNSNDQTYQINNALIDNILTLDANTGENSASRNTGGDSSIDTGNTQVDVNVLNIANNNVDGALWWLVLINEAGNWIGKIMGADPNANYAGSPGTEFSLDPSGEISVTNSGNGSGSTNTEDVNQTTNSLTVQNNDAKIVNNLNLSANTGRNSTSDNTNGNNDIDTGDATIVANLVNFVNNNIIGGGRLYVTVVNVFGSWFGDFVGPGYEKEDELAVSNDNPSSDPAIGGTDVNQSPAESREAGSGSAGQDLASPDNTQTPPTPTTTGQTQLVFSGTSGPGPGAFILGSTSQSQEQESAGIAAGGRRKITINLAYLLLALPFAIFFIARKKDVRLPLKKLASALNSLL